MVYPTPKIDGYFPVKFHLNFNQKNIWAAGIGFSLVIGVLGIIFFIKPLQSQINMLKQEKTHWEEVLASTKDRSGHITIPTMEKLPDIIESCQEIFRAQGVEVKAFNVERFAQENGNVSVSNLDYALVRMHWRGSWQSIEKALAQMEEASDLGILVQEVLLDKDGGQGLFRLYFRT